MTTLLAHIVTQGQIEIGPRFRRRAELAELVADGLVVTGFSDGTELAEPTRKGHEKFCEITNHMSGDVCFSLK